MFTVPSEESGSRKTKMVTTKLGIKAYTLIFAYNTTTGQYFFVYVGQHKERRMYHASNKVEVEYPIKMAADTPGSHV